MSWLDEFYKAVKGEKPTVEDTSRKGGEDFYCPQCAKHLAMRTGTTGDGAKCYRFWCGEQYHYRTKWHKTVYGAFLELLRDLQKGWEL